MELPLYQRIGQENHNGDLKEEKIWVRQIGPTHVDHADPEPAYPCRKDVVARTAHLPSGVIDGNCGVMITWRLS